MKTADLIPLILLELNESNKYGFELTKSIENKSNGKIIIKQPTLYTLLKKLEKSKFITSYWEDSEIGGKRHYYKLTNNGKSQISTMPAYSVLLNNLLTDDVSSEENGDSSQASFETQIESKPVPMETILPTDEVFSDKNIDSLTDVDINISNTDILRDESLSVDEKFASNENVSKFTEKISNSHPTISTTTEPQAKTILDIDYVIPQNELDISYVDYVNIKNTIEYKTSKTLVKKLLWQVLATSCSLLLITILTYIISSFTGRSWIYYIFFISSLSVALFYPIIYATNIEKIKNKYQKSNYCCNTKIKMYIGISFILFILIFCIVSNICMDRNSIQLILSFKNFASFYAPLLISSTFFLDILYNHMFCSKLYK